MKRTTLLLAALALLAGCDSATTIDPIELGPGSDPEDFAVEARWVDAGWTSVTEPAGHPAVELGWRLPADFRGEVFRVYSRRASDARYTLIATVTSCAGEVCGYTDANVTAGQGYEYYVATADERTGREYGATEALRVGVPGFEVPETPDVEAGVGLDGAVYLRWQSTGAASYRVFLERVDDDSVFYEIGSTDGTGYVDVRAENGRRYGYRVAAVDTLGAVSGRSELMTAVPRPDYHADVLYSLAQSADSSGFRFVASEDESPTVPGTSPNAHWRLESVGGTLSIVPLGQTTVSAGTFTTALTCGPGAEADCVSVDVAGSGTTFGSAPVAVRAGHTYVFRVGSGATSHYGKIRVTGVAADALARPMLVFDWAYQVIAGETRLDRR